MFLTFLFGCSGCLTEDTVNDELIAAACEKLVSCRDAEDDVDDLFDDKDWDDFDDCEDGIGDVYELQLECMEDECDFDVAKAAECVDSIRWTPCNDIDLDDFEVDDIDGCDDVWDCDEDYDRCLFR